MRISKTKTLIFGVLFSVLLSDSAVAHTTPGGKYIPNEYMDSVCNYMYNMYDSCGAGEDPTCPGCSDTSDGCLVFLAEYYDAGCVEWCA